MSKKIEEKLEKSLEKGRDLEENQAQCDAKNCFKFPHKHPTVKYNLDKLYPT